MNKVHFVDTCVMDNLLDVPGWNNDRTRIIEEYTRLSENGDTFVLPVAVLVETGNHIAQARYNKYEIADKFAKLIHGAIDGTNNWNVRPSITKTVLDNILSLYPSNAARSIGFGDTSILISSTCILSALMFASVGANSVIPFCVSSSISNPS